MREPARIQMLPDGRRMHFHDGPIDLILQAEGSRDAVRNAYKAAATRFVNILDELCSELSLLRSQALPAGRRPKGPVAQRMFAAVQPYSARCFITPMAAVAGAVAEDVLAAMTNASELDRAYVNNGGDIALYLACGYRYTVGMVERPDALSLFGSAEISAESNIRGVATSGRRGRSFSLGIADAVTVLATTAAEGDAAATIIANAVDLPDRPGIVRVPACEIAPDSDLRDLLVTRAVPSLCRQEIHRALSDGMHAAKELCAAGLIHSAALSLQGHVRIAGARESHCRASFTTNSVLVTEEHP